MLSRVIPRPKGTLYTQRTPGAPTVENMPVAASLAASLSHYLWLPAGML